MGSAMKMALPRLLGPATSATLGVGLVMGSNGVMMGTRIVVSAEWVEMMRQLVRAGVISLPAVSAAVRIHAGQVMMAEAYGDLPRGVREALGDGPEVRAMRVTGRAGAGMAEPPEHHVLPQEFREWFEKRGFTGDMSIDQFCVRMEQASHQAIHGGGDWRLGRKWPGEWNQMVIRCCETPRPGWPDVDAERNPEHRRGAHEGLRHPDELHSLERAMSDGRAWQGNWKARLYERVRERGYDSLTAFAEARPAVPLYALAEELGKDDVAGVQVFSGLLAEAERSKQVTRFVRDVLVRQLSQSLPEGWPAVLDDANRFKVAKALGPLDRATPQKTHQERAEQVMAMRSSPRRLHLAGARSAPTTSCCCTLLPDEEV